jgi:GntR family transcriptional regulator
MIENDFIDKSSPLPYYIQLKNILLWKIDAGEFPSGKLSSEHELSKKYNITITTVRKTLHDLENEGRIYKIKGLGTFIKEPKIEIDLSKYLSLGRALREKGIKESINVIDSKIVDFDSIDVRGFEIKNPSKKAILIERVRKIEEVPVVFERLYFSHDLCSLISNNVANGIIYDFIVNNLNIRFTQIEEYVEPINLDTKESEFLNVKKGMAAFLITKISYTTSEKWVEFTNTYIRGDKSRYHVRLR